MILSFDLDGVVADTDNGLLNLLHQGTRDAWLGEDKMQEASKGNGAYLYMQQYYARRSVLIDPRNFAGPGDEYHIVTGRVPSAHNITRVWVERWLGAETLPNLHLVGDGIVERFFEKGDPHSAALELAGRKLRVLQYIKADVHFDNNPTIVKYLRSEGMKVVLVGGGLL